VVFSMSLICVCIEGRGPRSASVAKFIVPDLGYKVDSLSWGSLIIVLVFKFKNYLFFQEETIGIDCVTHGKYGYIDPTGEVREYTYTSGSRCDPLTRQVR